ncbi:hypothetical protein EZJ19_14840 [Parasulfuritortus cantonensis]|uniref:Uncharacterized protein n=1 Tax=Parasulfuritortus cantonensis TaxID=2528202 RepID=A0A4R1B639_9PROT|nr:hypothetical protein [Parasulfuritortus cantonensis]TCJ11688.1 hypothetical protein EZJ19_14840 [Parasulfuritortus cantonensis]
MTEAAVDTLLREAMAGYRADPARADFMLNYACSQAVDPLPLYRVLYKFYNGQRRFEPARDFAARALAESARRAGLAGPPEGWRRDALTGVETLLASQLLLALKATAFLALRAGDEAAAGRHLAVLKDLDPEDGSGVSVVAALADGALAGDYP